MLDVDRLAEVVLTGTQALIAKALAPLREENAALRQQNDDLIKRIEAVEAKPEPEIPMPLTMDEVAAAAGQVAADEMAKALEAYDATAREAVREAIAAIPAPKPVDVKAAMSGVEADMQGLREAVAELRGWKDAIRIPDAIPGKDGRGIASAKVNDDGELVVKFTDGDTQSLGIVRGKDGADGLDLNALSIDFDGERTFSFGWPNGERKDFHAAWPLYRGVWKEGNYKRGDVVTWGGSQFTAMEDTDAKPETDGTWRLSVKRGRDGAEVVRTERKAVPVKAGGSDAC